jgi:hypothetical protein
METIDRLPATSTRVERASDATINEAIRRRSDANVMRLEGAPRDAFERHLRALEAEWDIERVLQLNASILALTGLVLGRTVDRRFLAVPAIVFSFFAQHALQGWCPPVPVFRRLGVRTAREIERERHAVKALRKDFDDVPAGDGAAPEDRARAALRAVDR